MATVELALAIPLVVAVALALVWALGLCVGQSLVLDAAREGARAAARGETVATVRSTVRRAIPGADVEVRGSGRQVRVTVGVDRTPSAPVLGPLARRLTASVTAWREGA